MDKRVAIATGLSIAIFVVWMLVVRHFTPPERPKPAPSRPAAVPAVQDDEPAWSTLKTPAPPAAMVDEPSGPVRNDILLKNDFLRVTFTNRGAGILRAEILQIKGGPIPVLEDYDPDRPHLAIRSVGTSDPLDTGLWRYEKKDDRITFTRPMSNGLTLEKTFQIDPDRHALHMEIRATNRPGAGPQPIRLEILAINGMPHDSDYRFDVYARGVVGTSSGGTTSLSYVSLQDSEKRPEFKGPDIDSAAVRNRYFAVGILQDAVVQERIDQTIVFAPLTGEAFGRAGHRKNITASVQLPEVSVTASRSWKYSFFAAPVTKEALGRIGHGMGNLLDYGSGCFIFSPIVNIVGPVLAGLMGFWAGLLGNFGVGILLTTLTVRLCLFWLSKKSTVSMGRMSEISPRMQLIKERYKEDPQKQQQETMKLFKETGVNPMSGCLPMLLQLPIWIGMYSVIDTALDLRQAPFMLWIHDLSQPDRLLHLGAPLVFGLQDLNLLPILMTVMWFLQAFYAPRNPDPQMAMQQKMMLVMPVVMGLMCYTLASGLSLYFMVNSLLAMAEQKIIKKIWLRPKPQPA